MSGAYAWVFYLTSKKLKPLDGNSTDDHLLPRSLKIHSTLKKTE